MKVKERGLCVLAVTGFKGSEALNFVMWSTVMVCVTWETCQNMHAWDVPLAFWNLRLFGVVKNFMTLLWKGCHGWIWYAVLSKDHWWARNECGGLFLFSYSEFAQKEMEIQAIKIAQGMEIKLGMDEKEHWMSLKIVFLVF